MDKKTLLSFSALALAGVGASAQPKNVLYILTDDFQNHAIRALGHQDVHTPNIDYIYSQGTAFTNCYTNGAIGGALSMPSRAMLMTGRGVFEVIRDGQVIPERHTILPEQLRGDGYRTFATGKWHSDFESFNRAFSEGENIYFGGMHPYETGGHTAPQLKHYDPDGNYREQKSFVGEKFSSEMYADAAVDFLNSARGAGTDGNQPFFAYVAFTSPHDPHDKHPWYATPYDPDTITLPPNYLPEHPFDNGERTVRDETVVPAPRTKEVIREQLANYYGMISEVDTQIGRLIETLRENGLLENTIVVFAGDNGLAMGQHGLMGKQNLYDHSIKVPLAIWAPGVPKGVVNEGLCYLFDTTPTLAEMLGKPIAPTMTGRSLVPAFEKNGKGKTQRDKIFMAYSTTMRSIVHKNLKYITYCVDGVTRDQLFDLKKDPWEMNNLLESGQAKAEKTARRYREMLKQEMRAQNDFCDLDRYVPGVHESWWEKLEKIGWTDGINMYQ